MALYVQSQEASLSADSSASGSFADLLTVTLTTGTNVLIVRASFAGTASVSAGAVRLLVDGNVVAGGSVGTGAQGVPLQHRMALGSSGSHTAKLQWKAGTLGSLTCNPASAPDTDHASLIAEEVTA